ncbi:MAG: hypothetical protein J6Z32_03710 [Bacteroidales bacterium]|nr:hypothetical protein [Bacteroidales bacterium]
MSRRKKASKIFYKRVGTIFLALFIILGVVLCLTVREYTANAYLSFYPEAPKPLSFPIDTLTKDSTAISSADSLKARPAAAVAASTSVGAVKEISKEREVELVDSCKADAVKFLRQKHIIKGAAISAMKGDFDSLLLESISNPASPVHKRLRSWHHSKSTRAMIKLMVIRQEDGLRLHYFTYDSLSTVSTVNYLVSMLKEKSLEYEAVGVKMKLSATKFKATVPWRLVIVVRIVLFILLFLIFLLSKIVFRFIYKQRGFVTRKKAEKVLGFSLFGAIGEPSTFNDKYHNAERWSSQNAFIAEKIAKALNTNAQQQVNEAKIESKHNGDACKKFINVFSLYEGTLEKLLESGFLRELRKRFKFNVLGGLGSEALNPDSPSYKFPDVDRLIKESGDRPMVVIHPALSSSSLPSPFLENAAFNLMVTDAKDGWDESASAIHSYVPGCEVVMTGLPMSECPPVKRSKRKALKKYPKATERYSFLVLLTECYTKLLTERTVRSLYESSTNSSATEVPIEELMNVELDGFSYSVQPFRQRTANVIGHLLPKTGAAGSVAAQFGGADFLVVMKAGCKVSSGFFENLAGAAASGVKCMQCRLVKGEPKKGRRPKSYKSVRMRGLWARYGLSAELQESGFVVATKLAPQLTLPKESRGENFFIDYLNNTYVFFL